MIKALLLIFNPAGTWENIVLARRSLIYIFAAYLLPLLVLGSVCEGYGLVHWGKWQGEIQPHLKRFAPGEAVLFETAQVLLTLALVFIATPVVKSLGGTFHSRHTHTEAFSLVAYSLSPWFLARFFDAFAGVSPWVSWSLGMLLSLRVLYYGVPRMMNPDPSHAFGLLFTSAVLLLFMTGLVRFVTACYLQGKFPVIEEFISHLAARLPF